jgi:hypothetical protein
LRRVQREGLRKMITPKVPMLPPALEASRADRAGAGLEGVSVILGGCGAVMMEYELVRVRFPCPKLVLRHVPPPRH